MESRLCALTIAPKEQAEVHLKREDKQTAEHELTCYEVEEELQAYEELRKENVKCSVEAYSRGVFDYLQETEDDADSEFRQIRQKHLDAAISRLNTYQEDYRKFMSQLIGRQSSLSSLQESISYKFQEVTSKHEEALAAKEREAQQKLRTDLISIHTKCQELLQDQLMPVFSQLSSLEHIPQNMAQHATQVYHEISVSLNGLLETISKEKLTSEDSKSASLIHREVQVKIQSAISELSRMKQEFEATPKTAPKMEAVAVTVPQPKVAKHGPDSILRSYFMRQKALSEFESKIKSFTDDLEEKSYRLSLQQYIRTNINAISTGSNEHLRQKFKNLNRLMSGEWIEFQDKKIIATKHQESLNFCRSYAAKTFIVSLMLPEIKTALTQLICRALARNKWFLSQRQHFLWLQSYPYYGLTIQSSVNCSWLRWKKSVLISVSITLDEKKMKQKSVTLFPVAMSMAQTTKLSKVKSLFSTGCGPFRDYMEQSLPQTWGRFILMAFLSPGCG